ncbi:MAG: hypothetical protein JSU92_11575 [Deltaproteobacteria bacterium]|nr:MAG: hypothetical protein JSU92_11575 [Deltaproteobacteria bacterium]
MKLARKISSICLVLFLGCAGLNGGGAPSGVEADDYQSALSEWTEEAKVYQEFETRLLAAATFKSWEFRQAYVEKYARIYLLETGSKRDMLEEERAVSSKQNEFFLSIYSPDKDLGDFSMENAAWKICLLDEQGNKLEPIKIKKVKQKESLLQEFYPYITLWSSFYQLSFPVDFPETQEPFITPETRYIRLVINGPSSRAVMTWELR